MYTSNEVTTTTSEEIMHNFVLTYFVHRTIYQQSIELLHERKGDFSTSYNVSPLDDGYIGIICTFKYVEDLNRFIKESFQKFGVYFYLYGLLSPSFEDLSK